MNRYSKSGKPLVPIVTLVPILLVSWFGRLGAALPQDQTPTFRAESDLVLVDLVVTDRQGNFVDDLKLEEVQVLEDGKVQDVRFFRLERRRTAEQDPEKDQVSDPSQKPEGAQETSAVEGGYYLFLLDLQTMDHNSVERSKESIREFLHSKIDSRDQSMLATIRPQFRVDQPLTNDFSKLERALDTVSYRHEEASLEKFAERVDEIFLNRGQRRFSAPGIPMSDPAVSMAVIEGHQYLSDLATRLDLSCRALSALSRYLGSLPGRKHVLYFAGLSAERGSSSGANHRKSGRRGHSRDARDARRQPYRTVPIRDQWQPLASDEEAAIRSGSGQSEPGLAVQHRSSGTDGCALRFECLL